MKATEEQVTSPRWRAFSGDTIGTFILVFSGCGAVACSVLTGVGVFQVAIVWGIGIAVAIQLPAALSGAQLIPAATLALAAGGRLRWTKTPHYIVGQLVGSFFAAAVLHLVSGGALLNFEAANGGAQVGPLLYRIGFAPGYHAARSPGSHHTAS